MSLTEMLTELHSLPRADKLRVIQSLISDLAEEDELPSLEPDAGYPVWAPHGAFEAADAMLKALQAESSPGHTETRPAP